MSFNPSPDLSGPEILNEFSNEKDLEYFPLQFLNINVVDAPLSKDYYWNSLKIIDLQDAILKVTEPTCVKHEFNIPPMPINSKPMKIILHMVTKTDVVNYFVKRVKKCDCKVIEVPITINRFQKVYDCPHRSLVDIQPREGTIREQEKQFYLVIDISYNVIGFNTLELVMTANDNFTINFIFQLEVFDFDPFKCILTRKLLLHISDKYYFRPIWIYNPFNTTLHYEFYSNDPQIFVKTKKISIERHSMEPIILACRPTLQGKHIVNICARYIGVVNDFIDKIIQIDAKIVPHYVPALPESPTFDIPCNEAPFILYRNSIVVKMAPMETSTRMVVIHNYHDTNINLIWKNYSLNGFFDIEIIPNEKHMKSNCVSYFIVLIKGHKKICAFDDIPVLCKIYSVKNTESFTDSESYKSINTNQNNLDNFKDSETLLTILKLDVNVQIEGKLLPLKPDEYMNAEKLQLTTKFNYEKFDGICKKVHNFIFCDYFMEYISDYLKVSHTTYQDILNSSRKYERSSTNKKSVSSSDKNIVTKIVRSLFKEAIIEISSERLFIPREYGLQ